jgi:iron complex outermembrane receptor protein
MTSKKRNSRVLALCMVTSSLPLVAFAADRSAPTEEVTVIGRRLNAQTEVAGRLGLSVRETPAIVNVVTQNDFQVQGVRNTIEAMNSAPGVTSGNLPGSIGSVSMRGFHRAVNYLYDGVRMANSDVGLRNLDAWSFERIEVIKGPASVTSGEGALAGAINFVPRRPQLDHMGGEVLATYGSFDTTRLAGDINLPLGEKVAVRGDVSWSRSSGWIDDTDSHTFALLGSVLVKPTDRFSATLSVDYFEDNFGTAYYGTPVVSLAVARNPSSAVSGSAGLVLDKAMRKTNFDLADGSDSSKTTWVRARAEYVLSDTLKLVSDSSHYDGSRSYKDADEYKFNATTNLIDRGATLITHDHQFWSQRMHLAFDGRIGGMRNRITAGFEVGHTDFFTKRRFGSATSVSPTNPVRGTFPADTSANFATRQDVTADIDQLAFFAENALNITDDWLLVGGLRYDDLTLDRNVLNATSGTAQIYGQQYHPISWRIGTTYSLTPNTQLFAQFNDAVTPIGGLLFLSAANARFNLTTGKSYEAGVKTSLIDEELELTGSVFHIRQDDILTRDPTNPALVLQGGSQVSKGIELALSWIPTPEINVALSGTLLDTKFKTLIEAGGVNRAGNRPQNVPEKVADLVATYSPQSLPISLTGDVRYNGDFYTENANVVKVNSFATVGAAVSWNASFGTFTLRGRNLTNEFYADWSGYASGLLFVGAPRNVELTFTKRF